MAYFAQIISTSAVPVWPVRLLGVAPAISLLETCHIPSKLLDSGEPGRFMTARAGDHLMTPFQCELCHFRNIMG
jgi:hypothetical protein